MSRRTSRRTRLPRPTVRPCQVLGVLLATGATSSPALAGEVADDAQRVETVWSSTSQRVLHLAPLFMVTGEVRPIPLSPLTLVAPDSECTTVGVLGAPTMDFSLEMRGDDSAGAKTAVSESEGTRSVAGALTVVRCGASRADLEGLVLRMKSPQGALEVLLARGPQPAPSLDTLLPERAAGPSVPEVETRPPAVTSTRSARVQDAERGILQNGGKLASKQDLASDREGRGSVRLHLTEGCHRLVVVSESQTPTGPLPIDVDCELLAGVNREPLARDRSFAPDGMLETCVAAPADVLLRWVGALGDAQTTVLQGFWALPAAIPAEWPARARAGLTDAIIRRHVPLSDLGPVWEGSGVTSRTTISVPVTAGQCYVLGVGAFGGDVRAMRLTVQHGARIASDSGQAGSDGAAVSFCAESSGMAKMDVNAIGSQVIWNSGLWRVGRFPLGLEESK